MRIPNINCIHFSTYGNCSKREPVLGIFPRQCILIDNFAGKCDIQTKYVRPMAMKHRPATQLSIENLESEIERLEQGIISVQKLIDEKKATIELLKNST